jgi:hypothetical protein
VGDCDWEWVEGDVRRFDENALRNCKEVGELCVRGIEIYYDGDYEQIVDKRHSFSPAGIEFDYCPYCGKAWSEEGGD